MRREGSGPIVSSNLSQKLEELIAKHTSTINLTKMEFANWNYHHYTLAKLLFPRIKYRSIDKIERKLRIPRTGVLVAVTTGLEGPEEDDPPPPRLNPASERGKGEPRPTELELSRRNESRCCLFSLSRNFFSLLLTPPPPLRNRLPVVSILTGEMVLLLEADVSEEKLREDNVWLVLRENKFTPDVCL